MIGQEMVTQLRESYLGDTAIPYLWEDTELLRNCVYAEVQACRRAHLIIDGSTANDQGTAATAGTMGQKPLCTLQVVAGTATYNLSPKILQIKRCQLSRMTYPLEGPVTYEELDERLSGWQGTTGSTGIRISSSGTSGLPVCYLNEPGNTITFVNAPGQSDTAYLVVSRLPLTPFTLRTSPEIEEKHHEGLLNWAAHLAFMKPDSDTMNMNLAKYYEDQFILQFGELPNAFSERLVKTLSQKSRMRARPFGS